MTRARPSFKATWPTPGLLALLSLGLSAGCQQKKPTPAAESVPNAKAVPKPEPAKIPAKAPPSSARKDHPALPASFDASLSLAKFATKLVSTQAATLKPNQNFVMSPMSVYVALGMTRLGAQGITATQLDQGMALPANMDASAVGYGLGSAQRQWTQPRDGATLAIANRLFADESFKIRPSFVQATQKDFGAGIQNLPFATQAQKARTTINSWVQAQTKDRIKDLLKPSDVSSATRLVLVNAIWFKGQWAHKFDKKKTKATPFTLASGKKIKVPTMAQSHNFPYFESKNDGFKAIDLPYADGRLAMSIVLPDKGTKLADLEPKLRFEALGQALTDAMPRKIDLRLPKFKMEQGATMSLRPTLEKMGMTSMFTSPDFSAMADKSERVAVQDVVHKAMIIVDEEGSEAAAATGVTLYRTAALKSLQMHVDRPFLFFIRDKKSQALLFAGRVMKPDAK